MERDSLPDIQTVEAAVDQLDGKGIQIFGWSKDQLLNMTDKHELIWLSCLQQCREFLKLVQLTVNDKQGIDSHATGFANAINQRK